MSVAAAEVATKGIPTMVKAAAIGIVVLIVVGMAWMLRNELIEKGENIIKAQDNAALVKAQQEQTARDAVLIASQNSYINDLQNAGTAVKEKIRVVQAPCTGDGAGDPRLGILNDWLQQRAGGGGAPNSGPASQGTVRAPGK